MKINSIDSSVSAFISKYQSEKPNSKFSNLPYSKQRVLASKYCRFVWASGVLHQKGVITLADVKGFNAQAENALKQCNVKKLGKVANRVCSLLTSEII